MSWVSPRLEKALLPGITFALVIVAWELGARFEILNEFFFSSPTNILVTGLEEIRDPEFWYDMWISALEFGIGYILALVVGVAFGIATGSSRRLAFFFDPWLMAFNAAPRIALMPLIVLWLGLGIWSKVGVVFVGVLFPVAVNTFHGVRTVDSRYLQVAHSYGASTSMLFRTVTLPAIAPFVATGARIGIGRAVGGVTVGEFFTAQAGLLHRIFHAGRLFETGKVLFGTLVVTLLALGAYRLVQGVETRLAVSRGMIQSDRAVL